ncbi:MAG: hypothetical protein IPJ77_06795 [Planctomycetes bacterium]|nr:hypothetical protein [Planctomycetota bacterium]
MKAARTKDQRADPAQDNASGVSVSIRWRRGGWALAAVIAALVLARVLGFL